MRTYSLIRPLQVLVPCLALALTAAQAQTVPGTSSGVTGNSQLEIAGDVPQACILSAPVEQGVSNVTLTAGQNSAQLVVTELADVKIAH